ncbi:substrate-binding domain-containing protein [Streptomyces sp. SBT349]|uniref:substrate-binding domain-containing protein n=1 Tax=Streptomyces sp. SBT349 TaxID=1580539 RepID=UPI00066A2734|nr:substrate-binding domain-containing protein [Streptomyces sp. SBT349]
MRKKLRLVAMGATSIALTVALAACGEAGGGDENEEEGNADASGTIGLLLPDDVTTRYETFDRPFIESKVEELCPDCDVQYSNAGNDTNAQRQQFDALLTQGVDVIILDAVDSKATGDWVADAAAEGVPVLAYDRLAEGPVEAYISYDNQRVGELQGQTLLDSLGENAEGSRVVMINGAPTDPNAADFKSGAHSVLDGTAEIVFEQDVEEWDGAIANEQMTGAIDSLGTDGFDGVYVANDGMAAGVVTALNAAGISGIPVGGQDAELAGLQRIVSGEQTFTIYKALRPQAELAGEVAVRLLRGEDFADLTPDSVDSPTDEGIPSTLLDPVAVTVDNIADTVVADEAYTVEDICTADYAEACQEAGLS